MTDIETLRSEVRAWQSSRNRIKAKINGQFTTETARTKLKRIYPTFGN